MNVLPFGPYDVIDDSKKETTYLHLLSFTAMQACNQGGAVRRCRHTALSNKRSTFLKKVHYFEENVFILLKKKAHLMK